MKRHLRIGIIGGGIGGAALSRALSLCGIESHLFERAPTFGEVGAGVQVTPNAVKVLKAMGLGEDLKRVGFLPQAMVGRNWKSGRELFRTPLKENCPALYGAEFYHVHRADLHAMLSKDIAPDQATLGVNCTDISNHGDTAVATFSDGTQFEGDLIVGADGVRSVVRDRMFGAETASFTGHMCWRALVPVAQHPLEYVSPDSAMWMGSNGHVVTYYVNGAAAVNVVAVSETSNWVEESWNAPSSREELMKAYEGWHPNIIKLFSQTQNVFKWGLFDRDPMTTWSKGRLTLMGDAAHPMLPFLSQGAAMAMEDGYVLAAALARFGDTDLAAALEAYEAERLPRTSRVQLESRKRGKTYHLPTPWAQFKRDLLYRWRELMNPNAVGIQANWVYIFDAPGCEQRFAAPRAAVAA